MRTTFFSAAFSVLFVLAASAQQTVSVSFLDGGRVTVETNGATIRAILNEWAAKGGTTVVGAERISGAPVTVKLVNVPEAQALETILRSVAGYMAAPRQIATGPSRFDRIMIMATTTAPPPVANRPANNGINTNNAFNGTQRFIPPRVRDEQREQDEQEEPDENPPNPPVFTFPQPGQQNGGAQPGSNQPGVFNPPGGFNQTGGFNQPGANQPIVINPSTQPAATPYQPGMPIGVSQPGMMVPPPPPTPTYPSTNPTMIRPPGRNQ
jgi:hypothetical protein